MSTIPDAFPAEDLYSSDEEPLCTPISENPDNPPSQPTRASMTQECGVKSSSTGDLVDRTLLDKIDYVRRLGIDIPLPQIVVIGAQSSGKSTTLESITGFPFPHQAGFCTCFATEIICRREDVRSINVSIQPAKGSPEDDVARAQAFHRTVESLDGDEFAGLFQEVGFNH
jgi:ABC-type uncharacterized transport system ATPase subunit